MKNNKNIQNYDICVIGAGRVGLPLALTLAKNNYKVAVLDKNEKVINKLKNKQMPFLEKGCDELLNTVQLDCFSIKTKKYPIANTYILTVGTPLLDHIEIDDSQIKNALAFLISNVDIRNRNIILRSTISPNTSLRIEKYIEYISNYESNKDFYLTFCPERIAEGFAIKELYELPQIVGCNSKKAYDRVVPIFESYNIITYKASFIEAELSKLFCNIYRYINFSIPNYFMYLSEFYNSDVFRIFNMMNTNYPRNNGLKNPGFAGATCVPGNTKIKVFNKTKQLEEILEFKDLYENIKVYEYEIDSFTYDLINKDKKQIVSCNKRLYSGYMYTFIINDNEFICTEDHLLPIGDNESIYLYQAKNILKNYSLFIEQDSVIYKHDSYDIQKKYVENLEVYNIELQSANLNIFEDDLFYIDYSTNIVNHNCLRKDWGQINESFPQTDIILQAYKINEFMPKFYIDSLLKVTDIHNKIVAVLGYTAKKDTDDTRDTLTSKLIRYINKEVPKHLLVSDPNLPKGPFYDEFNDFDFFNNTIEYCCSSADIIIIAMNHSQYSEYFEKNKTKLKNKIVVDGWGILNKKLINKL